MANCMVEAKLIFASLASEKSAFGLFDRIEHP